MRVIAKTEGCAVLNKILISCLNHIFNQFTCKVFPLLYIISFISYSFEKRVALGLINLLCKNFEGIAWTKSAQTIYQS